MDQPSMEAGSGPDAGCRIELRDVSFRYPNSGESALKHISFTIEPGETVAIVGDNGSGKSTLAKCVMGLYPADRGSIRLDGVDIQTIPIPELRKRMTVLFQDFVRYELSVRENVTLSGPDQSPEKAPAQENEQELNRLHAALAQADLQETIQRLPGREHTALGPALDHGIELSGGQWQKLALARALYKEAGMIILDEPTAAIDPIAEAELLSRFMQICADKTAVIITHRLACCVQADKIVVLQQGELAEIGTHAELMRLGGIYSRMFQSQAASYMHHVNVQSEAS